LKIALLLGLTLVALVLLIPSTRDAGVILDVHAIRPVGACESPTDDDSASASVSLSGQLGSSLHYRTNQSTYPSNLNVANVEAAIDAAFATWEATDVGNRFIDDGTTSARGGKRDGVNAISFGGVRFGAVAIAFTWTNRSTGDVVEADVVFSNSFPWSTNDGITENPGDDSDDCDGAASAFDLQAVAVHEFGHLVRLGHPSNDVQSMFGQVAYEELSKRSLGLGDEAGANDKY